MNFFSLCITRDVKESKAAKLLTSAGAQITATVIGDGGKIVLYAFYSGNPDELLEKFPFIASMEEIVDQGIDWEEQWQLHGKDYRDGLLHVNFADYGIAGDYPSLVLRPGAGFGDLSHATTRLTLKMMPLLVKNASVIDMGCGSGILSLAAAAFGAQSILGVDIDAQAIEHARANAELNNFTDKIFVDTLDSFLHQPISPPKILLMNMIHCEQVLAWESLQQANFPLTNIVTSGIRIEGREAYVNAAESWGWRLVEEKEEEGWLSFAFDYAPGKLLG